MAKSEGGAGRQCGEPAYTIMSAGPVARALERTRNGRDKTGKEKAMWPTLRNWADLI